MSSRFCRRGTRARGRATSSPAIRSSWRRGTSGWGTAGARTRPMSTTSSRRRIRRGRGYTGGGGGAHAPDEYYVIESANPKVQGIDGAVRSHVEYLYEVARTR